MQLKTQKKNERKTNAIYKPPLNNVCKVHRRVNYVVLCVHLLLFREPKQFEKYRYTMN